MQKDSSEFRDTPLRLIQITDTHLYRDPRAVLLGLNTQESFEKIVDLIASTRGSPDVIVGTGDIAQDASRESYQRFASIVSRLDAPFYWIPGNHDNRKVMLSLTEYPNAFEPRLIFGNWQILMLDTSSPGNVHGVLSDDELTRLQHHLAHLPTGIEHTMVCLHHNPVPGSASWMSDIGLKNADALLAILKAHPGSVRAVVYGHIHQTLDFEHEGFRFFCTPSTCIQFKPHVEEFALDMLAPAYRWFDLYADGRLETAVERLQDYVIKVDMNAGGY
ncbi:MAG: 3',5'-cyclic-AMP phosphodiesterase [Pseudohongiella sp.]|nr:3',5'-cyclic-AMP phosphodiesterase [Pseudohongiella sp.]